MKQYGLIGFPLSHSFSKKYFTQKFEREGITDSQYDLYELPSITDLPALIRQTPDLKGLNVTIPYKQAVIPFLDMIDESAQKIGAVNVIKLQNGKLKGYNSDYYGFRESLSRFLSDQRPAALVLGTGGASRAVQVALQDLGITFQTVSRASVNSLTYNQLNQEIISSHRLIVNTSPLGMLPKTDVCPDIPYSAVGSEHFLYDLVYNPENTLFMQKGAAQGAKVCNGLEMLHLQAEKAWEIWQSEIF
jgi:shikimate dehydrogenase